MDFDLNEESLEAIVSHSCHSCMHEWDLYMVASIFFFFFNENEGDNENEVDQLVDIA